MEIGSQLRAAGKIPLFRTLFFADELAKADFLQKMADASSISPLHIEKSLSDFNLTDVQRHTSSRGVESPIESWTYLPPNGGWRYGQSRIGRLPAVMLISDVSPTEVMGTRRLLNESGGDTDEQVKFYGDVTCQPNKEVSPNLDLESLINSEFKGSVMTNEGKFSTWSTLPLHGVLDLGP